MLTSVSAPACLVSELGASSAHLQATWADTSCRYTLSPAPRSLLPLRGGAIRGGAGPAAAPQLLGFPTSPAVGYQDRRGRAAVWQTLSYAPPRGAATSEAAAASNAAGFEALAALVRQLLPPLAPAGKSSSSGVEAGAGGRYIITPTPDAGGFQVRAAALQSR